MKQKQIKRMTQARLKARLKKLVTNIQVIHRLAVANRFEKDDLKKIEGQLNKMKDERRLIKTELAKRTNGLLTHQPFSKLAERLNK